MIQLDAGCRALGLDPGHVACGSHADATSGGLTDILVHSATPPAPGISAAMTADYVRAWTT
jgi:hypothetical protein